MAEWGQSPTLEEQRRRYQELQQSEAQQTANAAQKPSPVDTAVSPETQALVKRFHAESSLPGEELERRALEGTDKPRGMLEDMGREGAGLGGQDPMLDQALKRRAESLYGGAQAELRSQVRTQLPMERTRRLEQKHALVQAEQEVANKYYQVLYKRHLAEQSARNSVLRSIIGGIGTVAGAIVAGPAGAVAGGALANAGAGAALPSRGPGGEEGP